MKIYILLLSSILFIGCQKNLSTKETAQTVTFKNLKRADFQTTTDGVKTDLYVLKNENNMQVAITNYGGRVVGCLVPNKEGKLVDVVVGMSSVQGFKNATEPYFGATIGRVGNRINNGKFTLGGIDYTIFQNNGKNMLHGGKKGYQYVVWNVKESTDKKLVLTYLSKDGEENFPGNLQVEVTYALNNNNDLQIDYKWSSDKLTVANLTNHAFFNLNGEGSGSILNHVLQIDADYITPVDETLIPDGTFAAVENTPFDFRSPEKIGTRILEENSQLKYGKGYDHNYKLNKEGNSLQKVATMVGDISKIKMEIHTTEPGLQFYSGNFMESKNTFKNGKKDNFRTAFCLETQHFPDTPNHEHFPSIEVKPGVEYTSQSVYHFEATTDDLSL
ncbi:galactose mutarotase [Flammeovirga kamogawensis]|uniref:Aldose 1-epimerase n=2 Tax=Flammeovirga kamogawensis TaxID=373891 RepID=A0ABX8H344_9BACT|nr:galactose mutarotase [Flammeovirga kamogawensis]TRX65662.1 galactose mutarotase [Flammeovirga kamogawensis]